MCAACVPAGVVLASLLPLAHAVAWIVVAVG